ncbi:MAG TPA: hypothetical protein VGS04_05365 [Nitrososphaerales archaeon]|nr:hypothetical protein [Nitrososphaerales archaeon]
MTSRRLKSTALISINRTSSVVLATVLLCGIGVWQFFQNLLLAPFVPLPITLASFLLDALQVVAGSWLWNLFRRGAYLALAVSSVRFANLAYQSYLFSSTGTDPLTLASMAFSLLVGSLIVVLIVSSWRRMR